MRLTTYLNYGGNCEEAFRFYEQHLGGQIVHIMRFKDAPAGSPVPLDWGSKVMHARLDIGGTQLLGADVTPDRFERMRSAYLTLTVDSDAEANRIYALLTDGGDIFMKMDTTFFATRFAMLRDRFGTSWMLLHPRPEMP